MKLRGIARISHDLRGPCMAVSMARCRLPPIHPVDHPLRASHQSSYPNRIPCWCPALVGNRSGMGMSSPKDPRVLFSRCRVVWSRWRKRPVVTLAAADVRSSPLECQERGRMDIPYPKKVRTTRLPSRHRSRHADRHGRSPSPHSPRAPGWPRRQASGPCPGYPRTRSRCSRNARVH